MFPLVSGFHQHKFYAFATPKEMKRLNKKCFVLKQ